MTNTRFDLPRLPGNENKWLRVNPLANGYIWDDISITGLIVAGTNITITGSGTVLDPYVINSTGGGSGGSANDTRAYALPLGTIQSGGSRIVYVGLLRTSIAVEATAQSTFGDDLTVTALRFAVTNNTCNEATTLTIFKNGVATAAQATIPAGTTGNFLINTPISFLATDTFTVEFKMSLTATGNVGSNQLSDLIVNLGSGTTGGTDSRVYTINCLAANATHRTVYAGLLGNVEQETVEANVLSTFHEAATVRSIYFYVGLNNCNEDAVVTLRKNGADTASSVTIPAGTTGLFELNPAEAYANTDTFSISMVISNTATGGVVISSGAAPANPGMNVIVDTASSSNGSGLSSRVYNIAASNIAPSVREVFFGLFTTQNTTEAEALSNFEEDVRLKYLGFTVRANSCDEDTEVVLRKNGVDTGHSITIPAGVTGNFELNFSENFLTTDDFSIRFTMSLTATGNVTMGNGIISQLVLVAETAGGGSSGGVDTRSYDIGANIAINVGTQSTFLSFLNANNSEASCRAQFGETVVVKKMFVVVNTNTYDADAEYALRKNGVDTGDTITIPAGVAGTFTLDTNVGYSATDYFSVELRAVGTATSGTLATISEKKFIIQVSGGSPLGVQSVTGSAVDNTDPFNPVINLPAAGVDTRAYELGQLFVTNLANDGYISFVNGNSNEADVLATFGEAVILKKVAIFIAANTGDAAATFTVRKNGIDTAHVITVPTSATGLFELDFTESYAPTDTFSIHVNAPLGAGSVTMGSNTRPYIIVQVSGGSPLGVQSVTGDEVDNTDPFNPIIVSVIKRIKKTITSAQLLALHTTPVELLPAPGAGKALQILDVAQRVVFNTTPYEWFDVSGANTFNVIAYSENATVASGVPQQQVGVLQQIDPSIVLACGILSSTVTSMAYVPATSTVQAVSGIDRSSLVENDRIMFGSFSNPAGSPQMINGDSDLELYITYEEITL